MREAAAKVHVRHAGPLRIVHQECSQSEGAPDSRYLLLGVCARADRENAVQLFSLTYPHPETLKGARRRDRDRGPYERPADGGAPLE